MNLEEQMLEIKNQLNILILNQAEIKTKVEKTEKMVTGNGKIESGISFRLGIVERHVEFVNKFGWMILGAMSTVLPAITTAILLNVIHVK